MSDLSEYLTLADIDFEPVTDGGIAFAGSAIEGQAWIVLRMTKAQLIDFIAGQSADDAMAFIEAIGEVMNAATGAVADMFKQAFARLCVAGFAACKTA